MCISFGNAVDLLNDHKYHGLVWWYCSDQSAGETVRRWVEGTQSANEDDDAVETLGEQEAIEIANAL